MGDDARQTVWGFPATSWSLVRRVREGVVGGEAVVKGRAGGDALDALCRAYWRPLYALARGRGLARADAQDAVQDFFATALRRDFFARADEARGTLRSFLATAFKRSLIDRAEREGAEKRTPPGGWSEGDFADAEAEWARSSAAGAQGPDAVFERQWARELIARAVHRTEARYAAEGKREVFGALRSEALGEPDGAVADGKSDVVETIGRADTGLSASARRVAVFRLRKRFAEALRAVVAETLPEGADAEAELRALGAALKEDGS